jgi:hypothetical protein
MAATRNISIANCALSDLNSLIVAEVELDGGADSADDLVNLRAAQSLVTAYITSTAAEVGSDEDMEAIADDLMNQLIRNASGYGYC